MTINVIDKSEPTEITVYFHSTFNCGGRLDSTCNCKYIKNCAGCFNPNCHDGMVL